MGITEKQFPVIWRAIYAWMGNKGIKPEQLARLTGYSESQIERGTKYHKEWLTSEFIQDCVDAFGIRSSRNRGFEDGADTLPDEECIQLLTSILTDTSSPRRLC